MAVMESDIRQWNALVFLLQLVLAVFGCDIRAQLSVQHRVLVCCGPRRKFPCCQIWHRHDTGMTPTWRQRYADTTWRATFSVRNIRRLQVPLTTCLLHTHKACYFLLVELATKHEFNILPWGFLPRTLLGGVSGLHSRELVRNVYEEHIQCEARHLF